MAIAATYVAADQFTVAADRQAEFHVGRRVLAECGVDGNRHGTIAAVSYVDPDTTVTLTAGSDALTANLTGVKYGEVGRGPAGSVPEHSHDGSEGEGGPVSHTALSNVAADQHRKITISDQDPSAGSDGDVWIKYEA